MLIRNSAFLYKKQRQNCCLLCLNPLTLQARFLAFRLSSLAAITMAMSDITTRSSLILVYHQMLISKYIDFFLSLLYQTLKWQKEMFLILSIIFQGRFYLFLFSSPHPTRHPAKRLNFKAHFSFLVLLNEWGVASLKQTACHVWLKEGGKVCDRGDECASETPETRHPPHIPEGYVTRWNKGEKMTDGAWKGLLELRV